MLDAYWEMLRVFLRILRGSANPATIATLERELKEWKEKAVCVLKHRDEEVR